MILKVTDVLASKVTEGTLTQAEMINDPSIVRLLQATQLAVVANFKLLS